MKIEALKDIVINALEDLKAVDIVTKDVTELTDMTDMMVFVTGTSNRHVKSLADNVAMEAKKNGVQPVGIEGEDVGEWVLVDLGDIIIHVMLPEIRDFYDLERLWSGPAANEQEELEE